MGLVVGHAIRNGCTNKFSGGRDCFKYYLVVIPYCYSKPCSIPAKVVKQERMALIASLDERNWRGPGR